MRYALRNSLSAFLIGILVLGCGDTITSKTYATFSNITSLSVYCEDINLSQEITKYLKENALHVNPKSPMKLVCTDSSLQSCTNPKTLYKSRKEGYVRCSLYKENKELYRVQQNYLEKRSSEKVIERLVEELQRK